MVSSLLKQRDNKIARQQLVKVDKKQLFPLVVILILVLLLRLPSLFEPYWYGDEGIYFAVAETLKKGDVLYRGITDNKTPLIYYLFTFFNSQVQVRSLAVLWVLGTSLTTYFLGQLFFDRTIGLISMVVCGLFASLPLLEGNIANGELFFILPTTLGALLAFYFAKNDFRPTLLVFLSGLCFGWAILFKFSALFDLVAIGVFLVTFGFTLKPRRVATVQVFLWSGVLTAILPFALYFLVVGAFKEFLNASFFNNFSYTIAWKGGFFSPKILLLIKVGLGVSLVALLWLMRRKVSIENFLIWPWLFFSFLGATLSNRPYPHYLIQIIPSFSLLVASFVRRDKHTLINLIAAFLVVFMSIKLFNFTPSALRHQVEYYQNFKDYILGRKEVSRYFSFFDPITIRNYHLASYLREKTQPSEKIFIWGDEALIYKLANRQAVGRFVAAHHINDIAGGRQETIVALKREKPRYILVVKPIKFDFVDLFKILDEEYNKSGEIANIEVYRMKSRGLLI